MVKAIQMKGRSGESKRSKYDDTMNRILTVTVLVITVILLSAATAAIVLSALSLNQPLSGEMVTGSDIPSLQTEIANLQLQINYGRGHWNRVA